MSVVVQIVAADDAKAWNLLQRHSAGMALPNRTYVLNDDALKALREAGVRFTEVSRGAGRPRVQGALAGERV